MSQIRSHRRGFVLVAVLVCILAATAVLAGVLRMSMARYSEQSLQLQRRQTAFLLDAGVAKALQESAASGALSEQTWDASDALPRYSKATVVIDLESILDGSEQRVIVTARLVDRSHASRVTQLSHIFVRSESEAPEQDPSAASSPTRSED